MTRSNLNRSDSVLGRARLFRKIAVALAVVLVGMTAAYADQKEPQQKDVVTKLPARVQDYRYEDRHTFKHGKTYTLDPYTWVYTREFAQMFRMPDKWVDDNLKGALGIAFRMTTIGNVMCGLAGREDNCWPPLECQMDIYYDNRIRLPWLRQEIVRDFLLRGISSQEFLLDLEDSKGIRRYIPRDPRAPRGVMDSMSVGFAIPPKMHISGLGGHIVFYDREYQPNIGLIAFDTVCPKVPSKGQMYFYDLETSRKLAHMQIKEAEAKPIHVIEFPESFMRRANAAYERDSKPNDDLTQRLMKQFFESRQPPTKP